MGDSVQKSWEELQKELDKWKSIHESYLIEEAIEQLFLDCGYSGEEGREIL